jgi:hypothetical protein
MKITGLPTPPSLECGQSVVVDESHSFPCRRCLTDAEPGERVLLLSYDPWTVASPYRQAGPVYLHERRCARVVAGALPEQQRRRLLSVRAYDAAGLARDAFVVDGAELDLDRVLADPEVAFVHLHNAAPGCFAARVDR